MKLRFKKKKENIASTDSLIVIEGINDIEEKRIFTLLLKGLIVYLISAGIIGGTLSANQTVFNELIFNVVIFVLSMIISLNYYNKKTENIGDIAYLIGLIIFGFFFSSYINSGFYTWMNDIIGTASVYFDIPDIGGYVTRVDNISLALTIAGCYLGAVAVIIINMSIVKKMHFLDLALDAVIILFLPAYLELEPGFYYIAVLIIGLVLSAVWCMGGRYIKYDSNKAYVIEKDKITYCYDVKAHLSVFIRVSLSALAVLLCFYAVFPKEDYRLLRKTSESKSITDDVVEKFITSGIYGFLNKYDSVGGMSSGRLGGVNSVRLDYETDLVVTYVPYSFEPVYLRTFVGGEYKPYYNQWMAAPADTVSTIEYDRLKEKYENNADYSAKGFMSLENKDAEIASYQPYYSLKGEKLKKNQTVDIEFYPLFYNETLMDDEHILSAEEKNLWLSVPNDNKPSIINFVDKLNIDEGMNELHIAAAIKAYYADNMPYTLRPGSTPIRKDFVNYFLDKKKKGYCVHFASAATLAFRYLGIPARYVEGYALDYNDILDGKVRDDLDTELFYAGYIENEKSGVVDVELSDASAHAWVEIYTDEYGWIPVELTPPSSDTEEESSDSFWSRFLNMLVSDGNSGEGTDENTEKEHFDGTKLRIGIYVLFGIIVLFGLIAIIRAFVVDGLIYLRADINTRLVIKYKKYIRKIYRKHPEIKNNPNYKDQIHMMFEKSVSREEIQKTISILETAGFSNKIISKDDFDYVIAFMKKYKRGVFR